MEIFNFSPVTQVIIHIVYVQVFVFKTYWLQVLQM